MGPICGCPFDISSFVARQLNSTSSRQRKGTPCSLKVKQLPKFRFYRLSVYGKTTRDLFQDNKEKVQALRNEFVYDVTIAMKVEEYKNALATSKLDEADAALVQINKLLPKVSDTFKGQLTRMVEEVIPPHKTL